MKINFKYDLRDKVKIIDINTEGIVIAHYHGESGIQYQVAYFLNGERTRTYLYPEEISKTDGEETAGFKTQ